IGANDSLLTNLTGHPTVVFPDGFQKVGDLELPRPIAFTGRLFGEAELLAVAEAYQQETGHHLKHPPMDKVLPEKKDVGGVGRRLRTATHLFDSSRATCWMIRSSLRFSLPLAMMSLDWSMQTGWRGRATRAANCCGLPFGSNICSSRILP